MSDGVYYGGGYHDGYGGGFEDGPAGGFEDGPEDGLADGSADGDGHGTERRRTLLVVLSALAVVVVIFSVGVAFLIFDSGSAPAEHANVAALDVPSGAATPSAAGLALAPLPPTRAVPSPTKVAPSPTKARPSPTPIKHTIAPSRNPAVPAAAAPPAPVVKVIPPNCVETTTGPPADRADVRAALQTASTRTYWKSVPSIMVPERLLQAEAFTESTWRSNVLSCDGGIGLMQVMPGTVTMVNTRFGTTWKVDTVQGNAYLGGQYLAWSVKYLGDLYFGGNYDLTNETLLNLVIAAYNHGAGSLDPAKPLMGADQKTIDYVARVKQYMQACPCDAW